MKVAIIGTWHVHAKEYAESIRKNPKSELACCWDSNGERGQKFADELGIPFVADIESIWNDTGIDSISVTTATAEHPEILLAAAKAGKNIFTEKVLTLSLEDAEKVADAVKSSGKVFTISFPHKTTPFMQFTKQLVDSDRLGTITYIRMRNAHNGTSANWLPPHFYDESETGGGAMIDLGAHPMYLLNWLLGSPKSVVSMFTEVAKKGVEDNAVSVIEFDGGAIGVSETGFMSPLNPNYLEISGTKGGLVIRNEKVSYCITSEKEGAWQEPDSMPEALPLPINQWIDSVTDGAPVRYDINEAVELTKFMVGAYSSYRAGNKYCF